MSNSIEVKNNGKKLDFEIQDRFSASDCNVIIPFVPSGYEDYSNFGFVKGQKQIDNYLTYKRIYTGNDAFIVTWKGSTHINKEIDQFNGITTTWQLGEYILGFNEGVGSDVEIVEDSSFSDYKKYNVNNTINFTIDARFKLTENYKYYFYKVPEISKDILFRVVNLETIYYGRKILGYNLTLKSIQQELENTGRAKSQNVMPNAPGQGYIDAKIITKEELPEDWKEDKFIKQIDKERFLTIDKDKFENNPVKYVVVKMFGLGIMNNFSMVGRSAIKGGDMKFYGIPQLIFPINFRQATTPTLYRTQQPSNNYYFLWDLQPIIKFKEEAFDNIKGLFDIDKVWPNQGVFQYPVEGTTPAFIKTNPILNGKYQYTLYGVVQTPDNLEGITIYNPWAFKIGNNDMVFTNEGVFGSAYRYTIYGNQTRKIHDYLWDSYWIQKKVRTLPISKENTLTFGDVLGTGLQGIINWSPLSVIAGATLFTIGLLGTFRDRVETVTAPGVMGIAPSELTDFMINEANGSIRNLLDQKNWFKLSYYMNDNGNDYLKFFNTETMNTSFEAELTSTFKTKEFYGTRNRFTTEYIGQKYDRQGSPFLSNSGEYPLLVKGGEELQEEDSSVGYIIDSFNLQAIFSGDFSVEFLDSERNVIWSGVYQSEAKWTNSIREINTWRNTSIYGRENIFLEEPLPWPDKVGYPTKWGEANDIVVDLTNFNKFVYHNGNQDRTSITGLFSGKGWGWEDRNWNDTTYTGEKVSWGINNTIEVPLKPQAYFDFRLERRNDIKLLESNVLIPPQSFFEKYGEVFFNFKVNGKVQKLKLFDKNDSFRDEGDKIQSEKTQTLEIDFEDYYKAHMGQWYASFDGEWDGLSSQCYYGSKSIGGSASSADWAEAPVYYFKQKAKINFRFTMKFLKSGGIFVDIEITNFRNELEGNTSLAKENFLNGEDYMTPNNIFIPANVPKNGSPIVNKCDFKLDNIYFGNLPVKAAGVRRKGYADYDKNPRYYEKRKSIGYICGFEGINVEVKVIK